tara:strand:- start:314 stop:457 length:144 start_codon:yes stop_codon:yes gene_type:complete
MTVTLRGKRSEESRYLELSEIEVNGKMIVISLSVLKYRELVAERLIG